MYSRISRTIAALFWLTLTTHLPESLAQSTNESKKAVGILLVTHGRLGQELRQIAEHIVGPKPQLRTVSIALDNSEPIELARERILEQLEILDQGCGVLILTDMFGGTPSNLSVSVMKPGQIEVVAGVNIPTLIKSISMSSTCNLQTTVSEGAAAGRKYISIASELLRKVEK
jgi:PTS system mannose-specific IIA component